MMHLLWLMWRKREQAALLRLLKTGGTVKTPVRQLGPWRERTYYVCFLSYPMGFIKKKIVFCPRHGWLAGHVRPLQSKFGRAREGRMKDRYEK